MRTVQKKVCMLGDFAVGKTSTVQRFVEGIFDDRYLSTIGVKINRKQLTVDDYVATLIIWDLAGGDDFSSVTQSYLRGASGALLVCDVTRAESLTLVERYAAQIRSVTPSASLILLGNKIDLTAQRTVSDSDLEAFSKRINCGWLTTSAKTGQNVDQAFVQLTLQIIAKSHLAEHDDPAT